MCFDCFAIWHSLRLATMYMRKDTSLSLISTVCCGKLRERENCIEKRAGRCGDVGAVRISFCFCPSPAQMRGFYVQGIRTSRLLIRPMGATLAVRPRRESVFQITCGDPCHFVLSVSCLAVLWVRGVQFASQD